MNHANMFEKNIERVVDLVLRTIADMPEANEEASSADTADTPAGRRLVDDQARLQVTDLCGHVAVALRGLETHGVASYSRPEASAPQTHVLDVRR
jgi:hypothetical protein